MIDCVPRPQNIEALEGSKLASKFKRGTRMRRKLLIGRIVPRIDNSPPATTKSVAVVAVEEGSIRQEKSDKSAASAASAFPL
jgi:hypothetical protein